MVPAIDTLLSSTTPALDARVSAVIAESGFATLRSIFDDYQKRMIRLPFHYLRNLVIKRSELIARFRANDVSPLDAVRNISIPILVIAGERDGLIESDGESIVVTARGRLLVRAVCMVFDRYLQDARGGARYSRVI